MFNFQTTPRETFKRHFIVNTNLEIRYKNLAKVDWEQICNGLKAKIDPSVKLSYSHSAEVKLTDGGAVHRKLDVTSTRIGMNLFHEEEGRFAVLIKSDRCTFTQSDYGGFDSYWNLVEKYLKIINEVVNFQSISWLGIRKVNEIVIDVNNDPVGYKGEGFNPEIFSLLQTSVIDPTKIHSGEQNYIFKEDNVNAILRTGFRRESEKSYVAGIDIDFNIGQIEIEVQKVEEIKSKAIDLNEKIFNLFYWAIGKELISEMRKE